MISFFADNRPWGRRLLLLGSLMLILGLCLHLPIESQAKSTGSFASLFGISKNKSKTAKDATESSTETTEEEPVITVVTIQKTTRKYNHCLDKIAMNNEEHKLEVHPIIRHENYYLGPLDLIFKKGLNINCKSTKYGVTIRYNSDVLTLKKNSTTAMLNGEYINLEGAPVLGKYQGDKGYIWLVPLKSVCGSLKIPYTYYEGTLYIGKIPPRATDGEDDANAITSSTQAAAFKKMSTHEFIQFIGDIARKDYQETKILPSITIAQAILESGWGKSGLTQRGNNMFGIKKGSAKNNWKGSTWDGKSVIGIATNEEEKGQIITIQAEFRAYKSVEDSIRDHSTYLANSHNGFKNRYAGITSTANYNEQIDIIAKGGYATSSNYASSLRQLIHTYHLYKWDN